MFSGIGAAEWARWLQGQLPGMKQKQWSGLKSVVRGMLHYGQDYGLISFSAEDVFSRVRIQKGMFAQVAGVELPETQVYTDDEMVVLKKYLRQNADQYNNCLLLIFATGMRIGEAVSLKADDILTDTMQVRVTRTETRYTQSGGSLNTKAARSPRGTETHHMLIGREYLTGRRGGREICEGQSRSYRPADDGAIVSQEPQNGAGEIENFGFSARIFRLTEYAIIMNIAGFYA